MSNRSNVTEYKADYLDSTQVSSLIDQIKKTGHKQPIAEVKEGASLQLQKT